MALERHEELAEGAARNHLGVSEETRELYARHSLGLGIPSSAKKETAGGAMGELVAGIIKESRMRFDLIRCGGGFITDNGFVKVVGRRARARSSAEESLGSYIARSSGHAVVIEVPGGMSARLNMLIACGESDLPLEIVADVGEGADLSLFEWYCSVPRGRALVAPLHAVNAERRSSVEISLLHNENGNTDVGAVGRIVAHEGAGVRLNALYTGGGVTKSTMFAEAVGDGSGVSVNEIAFGGAGQRFDIGTYLLNSGARTSALLSSGAVMGGGSDCILKGYAKVAKGARGAVSGVEQRGMLLDSKSRAQLLPDMSVECRDVKSASHGASVAPISEEDLFYLMSRGMDSARARRTFVASFLSGRLAGMGSDTVKEIALSIMLDKLDTGRLSGVPKISARDFWKVPDAKRDGHEA
jgi:hypothetical protein